MQYIVAKAKNKILDDTKQSDAIRRREIHEQSCSAVDEEFTLPQIF
jgi:hypothetical protein